MPTRSATASEKRLCYGFSLARGVELALLSSDAVFWAPSGSRTPNDAFNLVFIATLAVLFGMLALIAHRKPPAACRYGRT